MCKLDMGGMLPRVRRYDIGGGSSSGGPAISISLPGVENHDTERRRQIALKALKDRLSKTESHETHDTHWPSLEENDDPTLDKTKSKQTADHDEDEKVQIEIDDTTPNADTDDKQPLLEE